MNEYKRKKVAVAQLLEILKELKPEAKEADVSKKLNTLCSNFRRELNHIISSARSGFNLTVSRMISVGFWMIEVTNDSLIVSIWPTEWSCKDRLRDISPIMIFANYLL